MKNFLLFVATGIAMLVLGLIIGSNTITVYNDDPLTRAKADKLAYDLAVNSINELSRCQYEYDLQEGESCVIVAVPKHISDSTKENK